MPGTKRWPTTAHSPPRSICRIEAVGAICPEQRASALSACPPADDAGDDRGADRRAQRHERAEDRSEQHTAAGGQDRTRHEYSAEHRRGHHVDQRCSGTRRGHRVPDVLDVDDSRDASQIEQPEQEGGEQGETHDVASAGCRGSAVGVGHAERNTAARRHVNGSWCSTPTPMLTLAATRISEA